ncbi:MAG: DUF4142 domain-containing protein [Micromonosporaceae bacterium]
MKSVHLVRAVACLAVAAAWAIPLSRPTLVAPDDLTSADRDLLVEVRLLSLLARPAGLSAQDRGADEEVRAAGEKLAAEHRDLDNVTRAVATRVGVELPGAPSAEEQGSLDAMAAVRGDEFDRLFVQRLRAAHGRVFPMIAAVRASTRNDAVRGFATTANAYLARHLEYLEDTGLVDHTTLPTVTDVDRSGYKFGQDPIGDAAATTDDAADRDFLVRVSQLSLWEQRAGVIAQPRAAGGYVKGVGDLIADEDRELSKAVLSAALRQRVRLPGRPSAEQRRSLAELEAARGADFDRAFVEQLRTAEGELLFEISVRLAGTRSDVVRELAATANSTVLRHMAYLEDSGLVRYEELPAPPRAAGLTTTGLERDDGIHPAGIWLMLAITVIVGALTWGRPVDPTHQTTTHDPSRKAMRHEVPGNPQTAWIPGRQGAAQVRQAAQVRRAPEV